MNVDNIVLLIAAFSSAVSSVVAAWKSTQGVRAIQAVHETVNGSGILVAAVKKSTDEALAQHDVQTEALLQTIKQGVAETLTEHKSTVT